MSTEELETEATPEGEADRVVYVDAICVQCRNVSVCHVPVDGTEWKHGKTLPDECKYCSEVTPHNILAFLTGVNRSRTRGVVWDVDAGRPASEVETDGGS